MITVVASLPRFRSAARRLRRMFEIALPRLTKRPVALWVFLVSDAAMRALNRRVRGKDRVTNVLAFPEARAMPHPELPRHTRALGEIVLAPDRIARQGDDLTALALHGLLHLFGYTHEGTRDRIEMERREERILHGVHRYGLRRRIGYHPRGGRRGER